MDTVKIGKYIAQKRKNLGLTQREIAEQLGMSDKSVSKWERGVCLPDVSVYMELCRIIGISLNEFIAGEDIEQVELQEKSEQNILDVTKDGNYKKRRLKAIIAVLVCICVAVTSLSGYLLWKRFHVETNYIEPFDENSTALQIPNQYQPTPEEQFYQKEALRFIMETLATCTPVQRERFLLHALDGLSFSEIAQRQQCSKYAVRDSIQAVRKKFFSFFGK